MIFYIAYLDCKIYFILIIYFPRFFFLIGILSKRFITMNVFVGMTNLEDFGIIHRCKS
jgi:hypothetical protein